MSRRCFLSTKIDRRGAGYERLLADIAERLTPAIIPMGSVSGLGTRGAAFVREPIRGPIPTRPRTDDPLNREEYLRRVTWRGVGQSP